MTSSYTLIHFPFYSVSVSNSHPTHARCTSTCVLLLSICATTYIAHAPKHQTKPGKKKKHIIHRHYRNLSIGGVSSLINIFEKKTKMFHHSAFIVNQKVWRKKVATHQSLKCETERISYENFNLLRCITMRAFLCVTIISIVLFEH